MPHSSLPSRFSPVVANAIALKAFAIRSGAKAAQMLRRRLDKEQKKLHVPLVDRTPDVPAPFVVAVVGPPGVGKTTLIQSLIKRYTKQNLSDVKGPITVVTGKSRRMTFFECPNNLNAMIDVAKIADLVLLLIDASFGFEMVPLNVMILLKLFFGGFLIEIRRKHLNSSTFCKHTVFQKSWVC